MRCRCPTQVEYELRTWLQQVESSSVMVGHSISQKLDGDVVDVARAWATLVFVDAHGCSMEAACLAHMDRWRFWAAKSNGYPPELKDRILHARASQAFVSYLGFALALAPCQTS
eukprot:s826_g15.t1